MKKLIDMFEGCLDGQEAEFAVRWCREHHFLTEEEQWRHAPLYYLHAMAWQIGSSTASHKAVKRTFNRAVQQCEVVGFAVHAANLRSIHPLKGMDTAKAAYEAVKAAHWDTFQYPGNPDGPARRARLCKAMDFLAAAWEAAMAANRGRHPEAAGWAIKNLWPVVQEEEAAQRADLTLVLEGLR